MVPAAAARRLDQLATAAAGSEAVGDALPGGDPAPTPRPLTDAQLASFIEDGFVALPVEELAPDWHAAFAAELFEHCFQGTGEAQPGTGLLHQERLTTLVATPTVRGALSSVLGPDFVQYPNRALQSPAGSVPEQEVRTRDDKWHKASPHPYPNPTPPHLTHPPSWGAQDQCYVPVRHHRALWEAIHHGRTLFGHRCSDVAPFFQAADRDGSGGA